ncbi:hypothetical protein MC885_004701 [Smutsia gigantea]|nr:hypothetical protein MC885_004701 [Smutsia gigantea]
MPAVKPGKAPDEMACWRNMEGPRAPANLQVFFDSGALKASVSWALTEGAFNYTVMALSASSELSCNTTSSSCTISSLQCGTEYLTSVLASNDAGSSKSASIVTLKTGICLCTWKSDNPRGPPCHLSVAWSSVDLGDYYEAFVKSDDGLEVHCNTSFTQCNFLYECGFTYFISIFAYNKAGQSPLGDVFNYTTAPCCPSDINPVLVSSDRVEIVWSPVRGAELYETRQWMGSAWVSAMTRLLPAPFQLWNVTPRTTLQCIPSVKCGAAICMYFPIYNHSAMLSRGSDSNSGHLVSNQCELDCWDQSPNLCDSSGVTHWAKCHTHQNHCLLGCITCGVDYTVSLKAVSATGLTAEGTSRSYSSSK